MNTEQPKSSSSSSASISKLSSSVREITLDHLQDIDASKFARPINILVTIHNIKPFYTGVYEHGLGLWINYILDRYLLERNIPYRLHMKSILTSGIEKTTPDEFIKFIKRHDIDICIPSDVTDTMFLSTHHAKITKSCDSLSLAVTKDVETYKMLEDKWQTYNLCKDLGILTPKTEFLNASDHQYPFFLKVSSGTNAGRGVWHCKDEGDLKAALKDKEVTKRDEVNSLLIKQTPVSGDIITAQIIFDNGVPAGFFFCQSVQSENLAGMGDNWIKSQRDDIKDMVSDIKVDLTDTQQEELHEVFTRIGRRTKYHGMMDIEFIINADDAFYLLEINPRFSGGLHTTLSNPGFLDLYFDVVNNKRTTTDLSCGNYSSGVVMKARLGDFDPTGFYLKHPLTVVSVRHWFTDSHHRGGPKSQRSKSPMRSMKSKVSELIESGKAQTGPWAELMSSTKSTSSVSSSHTGFRGSAATEEGAEEADEMVAAMCKIVKQPINDEERQFIRTMTTYIAEHGGPRAILHRPVEGEARLSFVHPFTSQH